MSCGVGHRHGSDPVLLRLWCRLAAVAPIRPLAWEPPYAAGAALKKKKKKKAKIMFVGRDTFVSKALSPAQHVVGDRPGALKFPCTCLSWAITWRLSFHLGHPEHQWVSGCSVWSLDVTSTSRPLVVL